MTRELVVYAKPVAKARPRVAFNRGKPHAFTPSKTQHAEWEIRQAWIKEFGSEGAVNSAVELEVTAWLAMPKSIPKSRRGLVLPIHRPDIENLAKTVLDALNGLAYQDDSQVITLTASKRYLRPGDDGPERWAIRVVDVIVWPPDNATFKTWRADGFSIGPSPQPPKETAVVDQKGEATATRTAGAAEA